DSSLQAVECAGRKRRFLTARVRLLDLGSANNKNKRCAMPRPPRYDLPDVPQHVVQRGNNRQRTFFDARDRVRYLHWLDHAGTVLAPARYRWSSFRRNALGERDRLVTEHCAYTALGGTVDERSAAYLELFDQPLDSSQLERIRGDLNRCGVAKKSATSG